MVPKFTVLFGRRITLNVSSVACILSSTRAMHVSRVSLLPFLLFMITLPHTSLGSTYWAMTGSSDEDAGVQHEWTTMEESDWAPSHSRVSLELVSKIVNGTSWCQCQQLCQTQTQCLSLGIRATGDGRITCLLSPWRGHPNSMQRHSGFQHYQRVGVARLGDWCDTEKECSVSDIYSTCENHTCACRPKTYVASGICKPGCPSGWLKGDLSDKTVCYYVSVTKARFSSIPPLCAAMPFDNVYFADVVSEEEQIILENLLMRHLTVSDRVLISLNDNEGPTGKYKFLGQDVFPDYYAWGNKEPNSPVEHCVV
ncbi:uncharacterized protein LOC143018427 isoform X2 [Oratosquilla oratoria]